MRRTIVQQFVGFVGNSFVDTLRLVVGGCSSQWHVVSLSAVSQNLNLYLICIMGIFLRFNLSYVGSWNSSELDSSYLEHFRYLDIIRNGWFEAGSHFLILGSYLLSPVPILWKVVIRKKLSIGFRSIANTFGHEKTHIIPHKYWLWEGSLFKTLLLLMVKYKLFLDYWQKCSLFYCGGQH